MTRALSALMAVSMTAAAVGGFQALSEQDAQRMQQKLQTIVERGVVEPTERLPSLSTLLLEREVNAYLQFIARDDLPVGLVDPVIGIGDQGRLTGRASVDLDAIRTAKARSSLDPLAYVSGTMEVTLSGTLEASGGRGKFALEAATLGGMKIPESLVQELLEYFTKTPDKPAGVDLDAPFDLPARIQQVRTRAGQATIVQ